MMCVTLSATQKTSIGCIREEAVTEDLFGPALGERALTLFEQLIPLYEYFNRFQI